MTQMRWLELLSTVRIGSKKQSSELARSPFRREQRVLRQVGLERTRQWRVDRARMQQDASRMRMGTTPFDRQRP